MAGEDNTVLRKVYFFKVEHFAEVRESLPQALKRIIGLPFDDEGRYRFDAASRARLCAFPDTVEYPLRIRFGKTRRDALPQVEHQGSLTTLELQEDAGLIDICHIIIFSDGFVAAEWNYEGPKVSQLGPYFLDKGKLNRQPSFLILMERDIVDVVSKLVAVKTFEIELPPDAAELAREADENFYTAVKAAEALGATRRITIKMTSDDGTGRLRRLAQRFAKIVKDRPHERDRFFGLSVSGNDESSKLRRYVDILENKLVASEAFTRTSARSRSIDSEDAYRVIERAYNENRQKLTLAAMSTDWR